MVVIGVVVRSLSLSSGSVCSESHMRALFIFKFRATPSIVVSEHPA